MALGALLFDLDGTLIDSNPDHVQAWGKALARHEYEVSPDRIAVEIGKGGDKLVPSILGREIEERDGKSLRDAQVEEFIKIAKSKHLPAFPGSQVLLTDLRNRGFKLAMATSSKQDVLKKIEKSSGVEWTKYFDVITTSDDASESKPAPHILQAAVKKLNILSVQCTMVGDSPYDADSARDAGLTSLGFTCGGMNNEATLRGTGMRKVYRDPADMAAHVDEALRIASPSSTVLTDTIIHSLMNEALAVARKALQHGEAPIGCVIARGDGTIIARGHNELNASQSKIAHAEIVAFNRTAGKVPHDARDLILVSTLEPCVMCLGASMEAAVDIIVYGLPAPADGGPMRVRPPVSPESQMPRILADVMAKESRALFEQFLRQSPPNPVQRQFAEQLLAR